MITHLEKKLICVDVMYGSVMPFSFKWEWMYRMLEGIGEFRDEEGIN